MGVLEKLPTCMIVGVLVMIFACLKRHTRSARLTLWAVGWTLVFTHFLAQLLEPAGHRAISFLQAIDAAALQVSAVAFLVSVSSVAEHRAKRTVALLVLAVPSVAYAVLEACSVSSRWPYTLCLVGCLGGAACFFFWVKRGFSGYSAAITLPCSVAGAWALRAVFAGSFHEGTVVLLGLGFALPGVFICRNYWDASPAVVTIALGFFCWGAVFPILYITGRLVPHLVIPSAYWDTPKLFVAFGMILAVVEDKSHAINGMQRRAARLNCQLERFSAITTRLLNSTAPDAICPEVTSAITELSSFHAALIHIESPGGTLRIAGSSGLSREFLATLQQRTEHWTAADIQKLCADARQIDKTAFFLPSSWSDFGVGCNEGIDAPPTATLLLIPLGSASGACFGSLILATPYEETAIRRQELAPIESLAADLAIAVAMKSLHAQLVWSEKLAAMGQLVAGVAHELNNPLTAIMGFGELMSDTVTSGRTGDQLKRLMNETRRMKRITDNLLRFSRKSPADTNIAHLTPIVQEVLTLCEYYTRTSKVTVETEIAPNLPLLAINEDEIKQVLLNLFNNSCDALQGFAGNRHIKIRAYQEGARAVIQVEDTGPGFSNLNRALDPFYTTKPVGKGSGLGLSICYGLVKEHGGEIRAENLQPGAVVIIELPRAQSRPLALSAGTSF